MRDGDHRRKHAAAGEVRFRAAVFREAAWLGVEVDAAANEARGEAAACLGRPSNLVRVWRFATNGELMIARHTRELV